MSVSNLISFAFKDFVILVLLGLVAVDNRTGSNTFSGYLIHTAEDKVNYFK